MYGVDVDHLKKCEKVEKVEQCMEWMLIIPNKCEKVENVEEVDKY